ncbi:bifunctional [glutamine synthetase] adenylyltransferase/[glutamine synthetase]-adenylyl-L-tyrosine phosphorylase [Alteraurantiacibacter aestuarii]|uniref:Bifunctional [glutamate--ammonia ligase]-adenylyl-L-tyrosine phosphorylase/[glutamate--ammonia-ligase] adenylyltransferase n=1 Tax=Alteraurantiacibacter aestuarii TaxID=650004 RepID=A0A844ZLL7_9SPHN|nr:bifunctional [glutamate--ammonia ligase]-adenylyl-L-tyrosine phosphorylase/[glutamate--ammonia-ligase] adenylyltransferase [Alteraurantiacibacter aestuarii]MXO88464.1 bifunctional [glutamate--ammonia ligase]-adenylyl-L-tyrosine phosphorylase/[glutamate--ammonia-ligase] adenylyltransferase [Alteraurantiacibacter aestuarii]
MQGDWTNAIERARGHSPFLSLALQRRPDLADLLGRGEADAAFSAIVGQHHDDVGVALRRERLGLALVLGIGDLAGHYSLTRVMGELSGFADRALDTAITAAIARRVPDASPQGFCAIALGKQGAGELNYSSDIDPILLFDPDLLPRRERDDPGEAAQRYARHVVELLAHQTGEGYVFRVDLRLRPASEVSPLAISFAAALSHYESSALAWERAAYIRARAAGGDIAAGEHFLDQIRPFVWRRSLDFTAIEEIRRLTARIRQAYDGPRQPGPGFDLKRGRGGIREIEFFAQTHQLIYGGRQPSLRLRGTRAALDALAAEGLISTDDAAMLGTAYDRLRIVEHRLQMVDDRQTHELPGDVAAIDNVARLDGLADGAALIAELREICAQVADRYGQLLGEDEAGRANGKEKPEGEIPADFLARVDVWQDTIRALRGEEARLALTAILPDLYEAFSNAPDPQRAMVRWETLLAHLPTAINLFRLFEQRPGLLGQVLAALTLAPPLADALSRRPELLDALIDTSAFDLPPPVADLAARMASCEDDDYESRLDQIRQVVGEERFALGVQLIEARHDPLDIAEGLCRVAEAALLTGAGAAIGEFEAKHGRVGSSELVVLGLGRLGGGALTHASDLDLVYLFDGEIGDESDGPRPLTASLYFNRLATRVTAALSVPTAEGALYEIDTRLRPQGNQGPLAVSLESFALYQRESAWTWEHMALCRSRPLLGSPAARAKLQAIIRDVLEAPRDADTLRADVLKMRGDIAAHKPPRGLLDVKLQRGGLVDCEFLVHFLQLREGMAFDPALEVAIGQLAGAGHLPADFAAHHAALTRLLVSARLLAPDGTEPPPAAGIALARACREESFADLLRSMTVARQAIAAQWERHFGEKLEIE